VRRCPAVLEAAAPEGAQSRGLGACGKRGGQARLPDSGLSREEHEAAFSVSAFPEDGVELTDLAFSSVKHGNSNDQSVAVAIDRYVPAADDARRDNAAADDAQRGVGAADDPRRGVVATFRLASERERRIVPRAPRSNDAEAWATVSLAP
jgi:hypothetical protein